MAVDYSPTLPFWLVTKDSMITELVYVNLIASKVNLFWQGEGWGLVGNGHLQYSRLGA